MEVDAAGAGEVGEEDALAAEEGVLESADEAYVVVDGGGECDEAAGVYAERLARREIAFDDSPAGVDEGEAVAFKSLEDEALAAEKSRAQPFRECDLNFDARRRAEKAVFLA